MIKEFNCNNLQRSLAWLLILTICAGLFGCSSIQDYIAEGEKDSSEQVNSEMDLYSDITITAEEYYEQNGKILSVVKANESDTIQTEQEITDFLNQRGFTQFPITEDYNMDGEFSGSIVENGTQNTYPSYKTSYITANGDIWTINVINGRITALPETYNYISELGIPVIISEKKTVMSYDSFTNTFFETVPNNDVLIIKIISVIDAQALEKLTIEEIDAL